MSVPIKIAVSPRDRGVFEDLLWYNRPQMRRRTTQTGDEYTPVAGVSNQAWIRLAQSCHAARITVIYR